MQPVGKNMERAFGDSLQGDTHKELGLLASQILILMMAKDIKVKIEEYISSAKYFNEHVMITWYSQLNL